MVLLDEERSMITGLVSPDDVIHILRLMGEQDEEKLNELTLLLEAFTRPRRRAPRRRPCRSPA